MLVNVSKEFGSPYFKIAASATASCDHDRKKVRKALNRSIYIQHIYDYIQKAQHIPRNGHQRNVETPAEGGAVSFRKVR